MKHAEDRAVALIERILPRTDTDRARHLLRESGGVWGLDRGVGPGLVREDSTGATRRDIERLHAAAELGRLTLMIENELTTVGAPRDVATYLLPEYGSLPTERFGFVALSTKHAIVAVEVVSVGTVDASMVHPRDLFRPAMGYQASAMIVFHNHPSGDPTPSGEDVAITSRLVEAGRLIGIEVVDHIVLAGAKYYSFREAGRM